MKAISLWQPWATLMAIGAKGNETRSWSTKHRGPLLIHAAKRWTLPQRELAKHPRIRKTLEKAGIYSAELLPRGAIIGCVDVYDVRSTNELSGSHLVVDSERIELSKDELCFGDYESDRFIWFTRGPIQLKRLSYIGRQGLFEVETTKLAPL